MLQIVLWQYNEYVWKQDILMAYLEEIFNTFIWVIEYDCPDCCHEISLINSLSPGGFYDNLKYMSFEFVLLIDILNTSC